MTRSPATPDTWGESQLRELASFVNGRSFKSSEWKASGTPIIRIQNLNGSGEFNYFDGEAAEKIRVRAGDLLFAWSGSRGTSFGPHVWKGPEGVLNQHIFRVTPKDCVLPGFLLHALKGLTKDVEEHAHGAGGLVHITKRALEAMTVRVPPLPEQRKIAAILSTVDAVIEKTEAVIDQLQVVKKAMMQELLTRGLPGRHTRFKQCRPRRKGGTPWP